MTVQYLFKAKFEQSYKAKFIAKRWQINIHTRRKRTNDKNRQKLHENSNKMQKIKTIQNNDNIDGLHLNLSQQQTRENFNVLIFIGQL